MRDKTDKLLQVRSELEAKKVDLLKQLEIAQNKIDWMSDNIDENKITLEQEDVLGHQYYIVSQCKKSIQKCDAKIGNIDKKINNLSQKSRKNK